MLVWTGPAYRPWMLRARSSRTSVLVLALGMSLLAGPPAGAAEPSPAPATTPSASTTTPSASTTTPSASTAAPSAGPTADPIDPDEANAVPRNRRGFRFKIGTFNVLGSQHTAGKGGFAPGTKRAGWTAGAIKKRGIDVIGLQEVQRDQLRVLRKQLPGYRIWPGTSLGNQGVRLQIAFRKKRFRMVDHGRISTRFDRQVRPIPWVKLRDKRTDRRFYVVDIHNSPKRMERERDRATAHQVKLVRQLRKKGVPVFVTADANEKREFYCKMTGGTDLKAANGGKARAKGCHPPKRRLRIDWILGGRRVAFSKYQEDRGARVKASSDHELVHARVRVLPRRR